MITKAEAQVACIVFLALLDLAQAEEPQPLFNLMSIDRSREVCNGASCVVMVRVRPSAVAGDNGCVASIDMQKVIVKSSASMVWQLAKVNMDDTNQYEFVDYGVTWVKNKDNPREVDPASDAASSFAPAASAASSVYWTAVALADTGPIHAYKPVVRIKGSGKNYCGANDPKINNDGP